MIKYIKSFKSFPKVFKLLWSVRKLHLMLIAIFYIINGILPAISILATQSLLNAIQTSKGKEFIYVLYPLIIYLALNSFGYIISQFTILLSLVSQFLGLISSLVRRNSTVQCILKRCRLLYIR